MTVMTVHDMEVTEAVAVALQVGLSVGRSIHQQRTE
jgi:hypothetical protein